VTNTVREQCSPIRTYFTERILPTFENGLGFLHIKLIDPYVATLITLFRDSLCHLGAVGRSFHTNTNRCAFNCFHGKWFSCDVKLVVHTSFKHE